MKLRDYQIEAKDAIRAAMGRGARRVLLQAGTGSGKTVIASSIIESALEKRSRVLFLAHRRELVRQCARKLETFGVPYGICMSGDRPNFHEPVQVASIQTVYARTRSKAIDLTKDLAADLVVIDECFPAGTTVDGMPIESIRAGVKVSSLNHETGQIEKRPVVRCFRKRPSGLIRIRLRNGKSLVCTPEHPIWQGLEYSAAITLNPGDSVYVQPKGSQGCDSEVQNVREDGRMQGPTSVPDIALGGQMWAGALLGGMRSEDRSKSKTEIRQMVVELQPKTCGATDARKQSDAGQGGSPESIKDIAQNGPPASYSGREWASATSASKEAGGRSRVANGIYRSYPSPQGEGDSNSLQTGHCVPSSEGGNRSRWPESFRENPTAPGRKKRPVLAAVRVDSVEVLEPGSNGRFGGLCPDGYVYNLEVEKNHNYFAEKVLVHNCHRTLAPSYLKTWKAFSKTAFLLGLTATPCRADGQGLGNIYQEMVQCPGIDSLTEAGWLVPVRYFAPYTPDLRGVKIRGGDYAESDLVERIDKHELIGNVVDHWIKFAEKRQTLVFACGVAHSEHLRDAFVRRGVAAEHIDGTTSIDKREVVLRQLEVGEIQVLCNCEVLTEGLDIPPVSCCVLARPTYSIGRHLQMAGRMLRPWPGKEDALLIDHAGNIGRHGFLDDPIPWSLSKAKIQELKEALLVRKPRGRLPIECPGCGLLYLEMEYEKCPSCGAAPARRDGTILSERKGRLVEISDSKAPLDDEERHWLRQLRGVQIQRRYSVGWVAHKFAKRFGRFPPINVTSIRRLKPQPEVLLFVRHEEEQWKARQQQKLSGP